MLEARKLIELALAEDLDTAGDVTTAALVAPDAHANAHFVNRKPGVIAGLEIIGQVFEQLEKFPFPLGGGCPEGAGEGFQTHVPISLNPSSAPVGAPSPFKGEGIKITYHAADGDYAPAASNLCTVSGAAAAILTAERTALNFICHLSGIATATHTLQQLIKHTSAKVCDTRKTTPGWRQLEKYAVRMGGGANHRMGLYDMVMIKDNHLAALGGDITAAVAKARKHAPGVPIAVEVESVEQLKIALQALRSLNPPKPLAQEDGESGGRIMLDNMPVEMMREAVRIKMSWDPGSSLRYARDDIVLEATGGITADNIVAVAETGVDFISVGAITHSAPILDIGLDFD